MIILLEWKKGFSRIVWAAIIVLAITISLAVANASVSNVWIPVPLNTNVYVRQNALGEDEGTFPWSKFSYPLSLNVHHTPFNQLTLNGTCNYGEVCFKAFLANLNIFQVNGTFSYQAGFFMPMPLQYNINFTYSDPYEFFHFLVAVFALFNFVGALLGIILAYALRKRIHATSQIPNNRSISDRSESPTAASCANYSGQQLGSGG